MYELTNYTSWYDHYNDYRLVYLLDILCRDIASHIAALVVWLSCLWHIYVGDTIVCPSGWWNTKCILCRICTKVDDKIASLLCIGISSFTCNLYDFFLVVTVMTLKSQLKMPQWAKLNLDLNIITPQMRKTSVLNSPRNKHDTAGLVVNYSTCISNTTVLEMPWFTTETALQYCDIIGKREAPPPI